MTIEIGQVESIFRYPIKSMAGERLESAMLSWHGIVADRRLALRRTQDRSGFPWLTGTKLPSLLQFTPLHNGKDDPDGLPTHVRTPEGKVMGVFEQELAEEIESRLGAPVQMMHMRDGVFDDGSVSVITSDTVENIATLSATPADNRRFRPNIVVRLLQPGPWQEDNWLGSVLTFGDSADSARVSVTVNDVRCAMVNYDPDSGQSSPQILKSIVQTNKNNAGIYGTVIRPGSLAIGQAVRLEEGR